MELDAGASAFGKQFKRADRSGAPWAVVLGEEALAAGQVQLKPLRDTSLTASRLPLADLDAEQSRFYKFCQTPHRNKGVQDRE